MTDWGLPPEYIVKHWTQSKLELMLYKRNERIRALNRPVVEAGDPATKRVPLEQLFSSLPGMSYKKVN